MFRVSQTTETGSRTIASCTGHIPRTMQELGTTVVTLELVTNHDHTCMGCLKHWGYPYDSLGVIQPEPGTVIRP